MKTREIEVLNMKNDKHGIPVALVNRHTKYNPFVVAWGYDKESKTWGQGHYFGDIKDAVVCFSKY